MRTTLGKLIKMQRVLKGIKACELAEKTGIPKCSISQIENDKMTHFTFERAIKIARVLEMDIDYMENTMIFGGK